MKQIFIWYLRFLLVRILIKRMVFHLVTFPSNCMRLIRLSANKLTHCHWPKLIQNIYSNQPYFFNIFLVSRPDFFNRPIPFDFFDSIIYIYIYIYILNWSHPNVFILKHSRVRSFKTQLIYCLITSVATCFDSQSHHQANLEPY